MRQPIRPRLVAPASAYTGFGAGSPGATYAADTDPYTLGTAFRVTDPGLSLRKIRFWLHSNTGAVSSANVLSGGNLIARLYPSNDAGPGADGTGALASSASISTVTMDAWNEVAVGPYALTQNVVYYAAVWFPAGRYAAIPAYFTSQVDPSGPIVFPADGSAQGASGTVRNGAARAGLDEGPTSSFGSAWYGVDVEVS